MAGAAIRYKGSVHIVAHADDTLLFMNPDEQHDIAQGNHVRAVFVTAGENSFGASYWESREAGVLAAFAQMAGAANVWNGSTLAANGHALNLQTLAGNSNISVVFMRLPDGNYNGSGFPASNHESLQGLWNGTTPTMHVVDGSTSYTRQDLVATLADLMNGLRPATIRTQDFVGTFADGDHSDHHATAYFTQAANSIYGGDAHELIGYMGYLSDTQTANVSGDSLKDKVATFFAYAPYDFGAPQTLAQAENGPLAPYGQWLARQYIVANTVSGITVTSVGPRSGPLAGGTLVNLFGNGFAPGSSAAFGAVPAQAVTYVSGTQLTAVSPPSANPGIVRVTVTNSGTISSGGSAARFTYRNR